MRKLLSTKYSPGAFNAAILLVRIWFGILLMKHGYGKLTQFSETATGMPPLFGMSGTVTAALVVFAEFFCALFVILGLFTRLASIPVIICMGYAAFIAHKGEVFGDGEIATLYMTAYIVFLLVGPGKVSVDSMTGK